jgi:NodT family efflux transporter outer membrane factor (OMF) lipoprotein
MSLLYEKKRARLFTSIFLLMLITTLNGCVTVGPDYIRPNVEVSKEWRNQPSNNDGSTNTLSEWWKSLSDPKLSELVERAVKNNLDLKKAVASIREARARRGLARAGYFPAVEASGGATRSRGSENTGGASGGSSSVTTSDLYSLGFDASWEIDVFGGVRRSVEAAQANLDASQENMRDVLVTLLAEVAKNYVDARTYQARIAIAEKNLKTQEETYQLTVWRNEAGLSDQLSVQQARYNLENTRAGIPTLRTGLEEAMNSIAILLGEQPGFVHEELAKSESIPLAPQNIATGPIYERRSAIWLRRPPKSAWPRRIYIPNSHWAAPSDWKAFQREIYFHRAAEATVSVRASPYPSSPAVRL